MKCTIRRKENIKMKDIKEFLNCYKMVNKLKNISNEVRDAVKTVKEAEIVLKKEN